MQDVKNIIKKYNLKFDIENYYKDVKEVIKKANLKNSFDIENYYKDVKEVIYNNLETNFKKPYIKF